MSQSIYTPFAVGNFPGGWQVMTVDHPHGRQLEAHHSVRGRVFIGIAPGPVQLDDVLKLRQRVRDSEALPGITTIYLDVDEVLANWVRAALRLLAYNEAEVHDAWDMRTPRSWDLFDVLYVSPESGWRRIHKAGAAFWAEIEPFPWVQELAALCQSYAPTTLLTSASEHPSCFAGKAQWIAKHLPGMPHAIGRGCKSIHAHPGALLIDDSPKNCEAFRNPGNGQPGGHAILFPGVGNDLHALRHDPMPYVREQLKSMFR